MHESRRKANFDTPSEKSGPSASGWGCITGAGGKKRFSRVNIEAATASIAHPEMHDNSYRAASTYGQKAHEELSVVRGDAFRKGKNKRKRSYNGGKIDVGFSNSFKFPDSDSD